MIKELKIGNIIFRARYITNENTRYIHSIPIENFKTKIEIYEDKIGEIDQIIQIISDENYVEIIRKTFNLLQAAKEL